MISPTKILFSDNEDADYLIAYKSNLGQFFTFDRSDTSMSCPESCREIFGDDWTNERYVGFFKTGLNVQRLNRFFGVITAKLGPKSAITIHKTDVKDTVIMSVPLFWCANAFRREFFTLFLRCGAVHYQTSFQKALDRYALTSAISEVVQRFLAGYTKLTFDEYWMLDAGGVVDYFRGRNTEEIPDLLKK